MFKEYDVITLKKSIPSSNLSVGTRGTILIVYDEPNLPRAYEIEFVDDKDNTMAIITLTEEEVIMYCK
jgi:hypothetical protein